MKNTTKHIAGFIIGFIIGYFSARGNLEADDKLLEYISYDYVLIISGIAAGLMAISFTTYDPKDKDIKDLDYDGWTGGGFGGDGGGD